MAIDNSGLEGMEQNGPDDEGLNPPANEPKSSDRILEAIEDAERVFDPYQRKCDRIDKLYSSLQSLSGLGLGMDGRFIDREYNLFWASVEVIKPSIYSRPPVPVVTPKFKDRDPVVRMTAELLERDVTSGLDRSDINQVMLSVRDDLVINARGVIWETYESAVPADDEPELVCIEHLDRRDFLHEPARKWADVGWVARRAWMSKREARKRFFKISGNAYQEADYSKRRDDNDNNSQDKTLKAGFWEVWSKTEKRCYWVSKGVAVLLDDDKPHLKLQGKFPCPRPAFGTLQRGTLIPVPDISYIEDQLESINELTSRIHGLVQKLQVKGLYPAGGDIGDAVEMALKMDADDTMVPVNAAAMMNKQANLIEWIPIDQIATTIISAVEARRELIGNVQELFGIADIMRGETDARETKGAQELKAQFGAVRIRDRVMELVRIARDTVHIMAEIMAEEFAFKSLLDMAQMEFPTEAELKKQIKALQDAAHKELTELADKAEQAIGAQREQPQQGEPPNPQEAEAKFQQAQQGIIQKYQPQIEKLSKAVTEEAVKKLLRDNKTRSFVFDIETDSTIYPDEQAEKEARNEFMTAFVTATQSLAALAMSGPAGAKMAGGLIKFQLGPYRAGRELEGLVDEWVESMENMPQQPNPEAMKAQAEAQFNQQKLQLESQKVQASLAQIQSDTQFRQQELQIKQQELSLKAQEIAQKPQVETMKEQVKAETAVRINDAQAQGDVIAEQARLQADAQTTQMSMDAEAQLEAQRASTEMGKVMVQDAFDRDKLAVDTQLAYDQLEATRETARLNAEAKAKQPKGPSNAK